MNTVIAITHDRSDARNRCISWLEDAGFRVNIACPAEGDSIPAMDDAAAAVIFGGRFDVMKQDEYFFLKDEMRFIEAALKRQLPFLGICLGGQLLAHVLGEAVDGHPGGYAEFGYYDLVPTPEGREVFGDGLKVLQSHWHGWYNTPSGATLLASSENFPQQAFRYGANAYAMQFHPEATRETLERWIGRRPAERYLLKGTFSPERQLEDQLVFDAALGSWFDGFLSRWMGPEAGPEEAAA